jgi:hypothetical protein
MVEVYLHEPRIRGALPPHPPYAFTVQLCESPFQGLTMKSLVSRSARPGDTELW